MKILMVCIGNICRSPMAEGIMREKIKASQLDWEVDSSGTSSFHVGEPPHIHSQEIAKIHGIDLSKQQARQFNKEDLIYFDKIYAMETDVLSKIKRESSSAAEEKKADLLLNESHPGEDLSVPDPWYGGEDGFHKAWELIEEACSNIIDKYS